MNGPTESERIAVPAIRFISVGKRFGGTIAVNDVSLAIRRGTVHALVGENGAGKSTLLGMLAGRIALTEGSIEVFGHVLETGNVRASRAAGVVAIYQELTIVPALTACANVFLGQTRARFGLLRERAMRYRFRELCQRLEVTIPGDILAGALSVADQQVLEILRALERNASILLLDEPTSALAPRERDALFRRIRELRTQGVTALLVSHNLDEVLSIADNISVCRDGQLIRTAAVSEWTKASLVAAMLGHAPSQSKKRDRITSNEPFLIAENVTSPGKIENVSLAVGKGEIVGLGGLMGSGRTTLIRALCGLEPGTTGRLWIQGRERPWPNSPLKALDLGIALIPENRKQALVLGRPAQENIVLSNLRAAAVAGFLSERRLRDCAANAVRSYHFDRQRLSAATGSLSGGNQQKLLLARWRHHPPRILLADEPTRGIDVGAKEEILSKLRELADGGLAILFVSSELEEVVAISDRVIVLAAGREVGHLNENVSVSNILMTAFSLNEVPCPKHPN
jgi:ABC-type sugar transport system ATPase subunit